MPHSFCFIALLATLVGCNGDPGVLGGKGTGSAGGGGLSGIRWDGSVGPRGGLTTDGQGPGSTAVGELTMVIRDFRFYDTGDSTTDPDFENVPLKDASGDPSTSYTGPWDDKEIVTDVLGADYKPVYKNASGNTLTTHGKEAFDKWYRKTDGTNIAQQIPATLTMEPSGYYVYDSLTAGPPLSPGGGFFPIDDGTQYATTFGNQGQPHNYSFTVEIHTVFTYKGGEVFNFSGDDDVFVYIDNKLVINLGGIHAREQAGVSLDSLGLTQGQTYALDFFSAERHVSQSNLRITTNLELSNNPEIPIY